MSQISLEVFAVPVAREPAAVSAPRARAHSRLLHALSWRWTLIRAVERASFGWAAGLALVAGWMAQNGGALTLLLPVCMAAIAGIWGWRRVSLVTAADRLDCTFDTRELFGTAARINGGHAGAWLATQADEVAAKLSAADVPLARLGRWWWGTLFLATAAVALPAVGSFDEINAVPSTADSRYAAREALLSPDGARAGTPDQGSRSASAASDHQAESESTQRSRLGAAVPSQAVSTGASDATQDAAAIDSRGSGDHAAGPGAASSEADAESMAPSFFEEAKQSPASAPDSAEAGSGVAGFQSAESAAENVDSPARSTEPRPEASAALPTETTAVSDDATEKVQARRVPARFRELVRRYFAGEGG